MGLPKILVILIEPPLPFGNAGSRWFHVLVQGLKSRGYPFDVVVASGVDADVQKAKKVFKDWPNFYIFPFDKPKGVFSKFKTFFFPHRFAFSKEFAECLTKLNPDSYDLIHVEQTWAGWMTWAWPQKTLINVHYLQAIDLEFVQPENWKQKLMFYSWFKAEKKILMHYPHIRTCSPRLRDAIVEWGDKKHLQSIPFGIDLSLYPFIPLEKRQTAQPIVTIIGNMNWYPSLSAARRLIAELWPEIKKQVPQARVRIVGWSARKNLQEYLNQQDVEILEDVPEIQPYFEQASVIVYAPGRGSGMKIKIQEALAFGIPVVTTSEGAEGLMAHDMIDMCISDDNAGLIAKTVAVLKDIELQERLRLQGRKMLEACCGPDVTFQQIEALHHKIIASNK